MLPRPMITQSFYLRDYLISKTSERELASFTNQRVFLDDIFRLQSSSGPELNREFVHKFQLNLQVPDKHRCMVCLQEFKTKQGLNQHMGKLHHEDSKQVPCPECGKVFKHKYAVRYHIKQVHEKSTRIECDICQCSFYNKYELAKHKSKKHLIGSQTI